MHKLKYEKKRLKMEIVENGKSCDVIFFIKSILYLFYFNRKIKIVNSIITKYYIEYI